MSTPTTSVTIQAIGNGALLSKSAPTIPIGSTLQIQTTALDANGLASGQKVLITSSDNLIVRPIGGSELGYANEAVQAMGAGVATITATASDNAAVTATLTVTVV